MTRPPLEVADLVRTAGTPFIERNRQWLRWTLYDRQGNLRTKVIGFEYTDNNESTLKPLL